MIRRVIDLNADLGEWVHAEQARVDAALLTSVSSSNIACGGHAGDPASMKATVRLAAKLGVAIGAHPGYPDRRNFGRLSVNLRPEEIEATIFEQLASLQRVVNEEGARLGHVKLHGALYHDAMGDEQVAAAAARAVVRIDPTFIMIGLAGAPALAWWRALGLRVAAEAFADRRYETAATLMPRSRPDSLFERPDEAANQAEGIVSGAGVIAADGRVVAVRADTICIHSDTPGAPAIAAAVRARLDAIGAAIQPLGERPH